MYSAQLHKAEFLSLKKKAAESGQKALSRVLLQGNREMLAFRKAQSENESQFTQKELPERFVSEIQKISAFLGEWLEEHKNHILYADVLSLFFEVRFFLKIAELYDDHFITCVRFDRSDVILQLLCFCLLYTSRCV